MSYHIVSDGLAVDTHVYDPGGEPIERIQKIEWTIELHRPAQMKLTIRPAAGSVMAELSEEILEEMQERLGQCNLDRPESRRAAISNLLELAEQGGLIVRPRS